MNENRHDEISENESNLYRNEAGSDLILPKPTATPPKSKSQVWLKSISSLFLYVAIGYIFFNQNWLLVLVLSGVVIFHELGHFLAMKIYNYKDLGIFFIPLMGAYVTGSKNEVSQKQSAIILLAGPVPGIILGIIIYFLAVNNNDYMLERIAWILIYLNVLNLLPVHPLDGGQLLNRLFLDSYHIIGKIFIVLSAIAMGIFAWVISFYPLLIFPVMLLIRLFTDVQYDRLTNRLEDEGIDLDKDYNDLTDQEYWQIRNALIRHSADYKDLSPSPPYAYAENEYKVVSGIQSVLQRSLYQDLSIGGKILVIIIWIACFFVPAWLSLPIRFF